jgi:DNA repair photolyase
MASTSVIYRPKGKALEYCELAANLYRGCGHGCTYCYAPGVLYTSRDKFLTASPRPDIIKKIEQDATNLGKDESMHGRQVLLCFTCDPYQPLDDEYRLTRQAIKILHENRLNVRILTKGGKRSEKDFDLLGKDDAYAATLTFADNRLSAEFEPYASHPEERFTALSRAHDLGIPTWASLEPVINPDETLEIIRQTSSYVDMYKIGVWNYDKRSAELDYSGFIKKAIELIDSAGAQYYIKKDMVKYL